MYHARIERSVAHAKDVAERLSIDLFDDRYRGHFRQIVDNCATCAYQTQCHLKIVDGTPLEGVPTHCRNKEFFAPGE
ncbi:MAG: hypothetical protein Gyms2KO_17300 [Gymnodinialimonas sp.]